MSSDATPRLNIAILPPTPAQPQVTHNEALHQIDALSDICLLGRFVNAPPGTASDGDTYLLGGAPTGAWSGQAYKLAYCLDGGWCFFAPFNGLHAIVAASRALLVYVNGSWLDTDALTNAGEVSIASAATCDLGAAASLFVAITGTTTITSLGAGANLLRYVRFAGALTLTHNAVSLILPGGVSIATAAGDTAVFASDASGNWRCRLYSRANGVPACFAGLTGSGNAVGSAAPTFTGTMNVAGVTHTVPDSNAAMSVINSGSGNKQWVLYPVGNNLAVREAGIADVMTFGAGGAVMVGSAVNGGWAGNARAAVQGAGSKVLSVYASGAGQDAVDVRIDATSSNFATFRYNGATAVGAITTNGSATIYATISDERLKDWQIGQCDYRGAIRALWVGDFRWKQDGRPGFGVRAQQAWSVMPCHAGAGVMEDGTWQASAEPFAFLSLWGVKDLYALVEALATRIAALEAAHDAG